MFLKYSQNLSICSFKHHYISERTQKDLKTDKTLAKANNKGHMKMNLMFL